MTEIVSRSRGRTYTLLTGLVTGMFLAGLVVPYAFGERPADVLSSNPSMQPATPLPVPSLPAVTAASGAPAKAPSAAGGPRTAPGPASLSSGVSAGLPTGVPGATQGATLTASDQGVTASTIKIGLGVLDTGSVSKFAPSGSGGSATSSQDNIKKQKDVWNALVAWVNSQGGLYGRKIIPDFQTFDPLNADSMRQACIAWAENDKVFAVGSDTYYGDPIQCLTTQHRIPFITNTGGQSTEYTPAKGYNLALVGDGDRLLANLVYQLQIRNLLKGHKIGILDDASSKYSVSRGLIPALSRAGMSVTDEETLPDNQTGTAAIVTAQESMQAKGVDLVLPALNVIEIGIFAQQGHQNGWNPQYYVSDFEGDATDAATIFYSNFVDKNMVAFAAFREGEARAGMPEPALDASCRRAVEKGTGKPLTRGTVDYQGAMDECNFLLIFARMAHDAGPVLTRQKAVDAFHRLTDVTWAYLGGTQTTRPGKDFGGDYVRVVQYAASCTCWTAEGPFAKGAY